MKKFVKPWLVVLLAHVVYLGLILARNNGDPLAFAKIGTTDCYGNDPGYDGQFTYFIARDPSPSGVAPALDVPAYRYQRILLPLLARLLAFSQPGLIPWTIVLINLIAQTAGTAVLEKLLTALGAIRWAALVYGLWPGLVVSVRTDIAEPLSYSLIVFAYLLDRRDRIWLAALFFGLAVFAKETAILFVAAQLAYSLFSRDGRRLVSLSALSALPFVVWQLVLWKLFGSFGLGSGGCKGTPFEIVPFMGVWRILPLNAIVFVVFLLFLGPWVMFPSVWGIAASAREVLRRNWHPYVWALGANAVIIPFTPFSTFREPIAMLRFCCGLVLATLLFGGLVKSRRVLNYSWFWLAMLVFLVKD
ncbi:MAG: hypothetical protein HYZ49_20440 [Chloroflexi bacterium]|nr:hypothetical protein [Chloroflexota bacterium]